MKQVKLSGKNIYVQMDLDLQIMKLYSLLALIILEYQVNEFLKIIENELQNSNEIITRFCSNKWKYLEIPLKIIKQIKI